MVTVLVWLLATIDEEIEILVDAGNRFLQKWAHVTRHQLIAWSLISVAGTFAGCEIVWTIWEAQQSSWDCWSTVGIIALLWSPTFWLYDRLAKHVLRSAEGRPLQARGGLSKAARALRLVQTAAVLAFFGHLGRHGVIDVIRDAAMLLSIYLLSCSDIHPSARSSIRDLLRSRRPAPVTQT